jgi:hypothetical protein
MTIKTHKNLLLNDVDWRIGENVDGVYVRKHQIITDEFLDDLKDRRHVSSSVREKDYMHVASIPVGIVEKWMREGFDILSDKNITHAQIVARLKNEGLDAFLATNKKV